MASPAVIPFDGQGQATNSFAASITGADAGSVIHAGDALIVGVATDGTQFATAAIANGVSMVKVASGVNGDVTWSIWACAAAFDTIGFIAEAFMNASFDDACMMWTIVRSPTGYVKLDPHPSLGVPSTGSPPATLVYSTSIADDLIFFFSFGHNGLWIAPPPDVIAAPWHYLVTSGNSGGFGFIGGSLYQQSVSSVQVNQTADSITPVAGNTVFVVIALAPASPPGTGIPKPLFLPPPISSPCVQPCMVVIDPSSHAFGMYYGNLSLPNKGVNEVHSEGFTLDL